MIPWVIYPFPPYLALQGAVWSCVLNDSALLCATASADFSARVWDACSGNQLQEFAHSHIVRSTAFSRHSNRLATGCESRDHNISSSVHYDHHEL